VVPSGLKEDSEYRNNTAEVIKLDEKNLRNKLGYLTVGDPVRMVSELDRLVSVLYN
jgi:hypothetical protein